MPESSEFENKTCKDCDFFERAPCITPEGDYSEDPDRRICINFAPMEED